MLGIIMSLAVVFAVCEKLEDFLTNEPSAYALIIDYYLNFVIYYTNLFSVTDIHCRFILHGKTCF